MRAEGPGKIGNQDCSRDGRAKYAAMLESARAKGVAMLQERVAKLKATSEFQDEEEFIATAKFYIEHGKRPNPQELDDYKTKMELGLNERIVQLGLQEIFMYAKKPLPTFDELVNELRGAQEEQRSRQREFEKREEPQRGLQQGTIIDLERVGDTNTFTYSQTDDKPSISLENPHEPIIDEWARGNPLIDPISSDQGSCDSNFGFFSNDLSDGSFRLKQDQEQFRQGMQEQQDESARRMQEDEERRQQEEAQRQREMDDLLWGLGHKLD